MKVSYLIAITAIIIMGNAAAYAETDWDCIFSDRYPECASTPVENATERKFTQSEIEQEAQFADAYVVVFSGPTVATYDNMNQYQRDLVVGDQAYSMGDESDNYVKEHDIPLITVAANGVDQYKTEHNLNSSCCGDMAIGVLTGNIDSTANTQIEIPGWWFLVIIGIVGGAIAVSVAVRVL